MQVAGRFQKLLSIALVVASSVSAFAEVIFPFREIVFEVKDRQPEPFARELWAWVAGDNGGIWVPAFYAGGETWKVRFTPRSEGGYRVHIFEMNNGRRVAKSVSSLNPEIFQVEGAPAAKGFVQVNPAIPQLFQKSNGTAYFPLGMNIGWDVGAQGDVVAFLERLAGAGGNWARIWMCHWDDKNLDWSQQKKIAPGELDLEAAARWDRIVETADRLDIGFQLVLQHHGQYSTQVNANWQDNPWNKANGGFLERPEDFFTDARARELTKRKYRYIVARYGYSPSIMAWELFNEVEFTDAGKSGQFQSAVLAWHREMAAYLRSIDPWQHLITTSALPINNPVWTVTDYFQQHLYPPDPLIGAGGFEVTPLALSRPIFYGEIGSVDSGGQTEGDGGRVLRNVLWNSLFSGAGAAAQYWAWDHADREKAFPILAGAAGFARLAGLGRALWRPVEVSVKTSGRSDLVFGPGQMWESVVDPQLQLRRVGTGRAEGTGFSATLRPRRGSGEKEGIDTVSFHVRVEKPTRWEVVLGEISRDGARIQLEVDGKALLSREWSAGQVDENTAALSGALSVNVPVGASLLRIKSNGSDYFRISSVKLADYVPELGIRASTDNENIIAWIYRNDALSLRPLDRDGAKTSVGDVSFNGVLDGGYRAIWWDTARAVVFKEEDVQAREGRIELTTPVVSHDVALFLRRLTPGVP